MSDWGFTETELTVAMKVLDKLHRNAHLLDDPEIKMSGIKKYLNDQVFVAKGSIPGAPGRANAGSFSPTNRAMSPGRAPMASSPTNRAQSPTARAGSPTSGNRAPSGTTTIRNPANNATMVVQDRTADGPSGSSKYSSGKSASRTACTSHKYGPPPS